MSVSRRTFPTSRAAIGGALTLTLPSMVRALDADRASGARRKAAPLRILIGEWDVVVDNPTANQVRAWNDMPVWVPPAGRTAGLAPDREPAVLAAQHASGL